MIERIQNVFNEIWGLNFTEIIEEQDAKEYSGVNFYFRDLNFKFRKAKITPKKVGLFVTLWKRNKDNITEPFSEQEHTDFYIIATEDKEKFGFFIFPKSVLIQHNILSTKFKEGKRGFRVYPTWTTTINKQAIKTQLWQKKYFINAENEDKRHFIDLKTILDNA